MRTRAAISAEPGPWSRAWPRIGACIAGRVLGWQPESRCSTLDHVLRMRHEFIVVFRSPDVVSGGR